MSSKRHTPEQIINKLRQGEVELAKGIGVMQALMVQWRGHHNTVR